MLCSIGVAGWSIPPQAAPHFIHHGTHLQRYASRFSAVEINSSFYRPHRRATYERWADSVPADFRFAVKLPKIITHERRLSDCDDLVVRFADEISGLGNKLGPVLVQLPPSFTYSRSVAEPFFELMNEHAVSSVVLEPRHRSWFEPEVEGMLVSHRVARVAANPANVPAAAVPAGWKGLAYFRLHGSPDIYKSAYGLDAIKAQAVSAGSLAVKGADVWTIFDNTTYGAAFENALQLKEALG